VPDRGVPDSAVRRRRACGRSSRSGQGRRASPGRLEGHDLPAEEGVHEGSRHAKDGADRKFKMPSNDIHPLPNTKEGFEAKLKVEPSWPKWTEFMAQKVEPAMGKLLDIPVFDPKKPVEGAFGCNRCHKLEAAKN
jgi:hypothetical protein